MRVEATLHGDRKVYSVSAVNRGIASWLTRLPTLWVEGEVTELRRQDGWQSVFLTLKDLEDGSACRSRCRGRPSTPCGSRSPTGTRVHVYGRPELYEARGVFQLRALSLEPLGLGAALARIERLKKALAAEGLFAAERKRRLPILPRRIGLTGNDAAAKRDFLTAVAARFPAARVLVAETLVQGEGAGRDRLDARGALRRARDRRRRGRPRRRRLRGPPPFQRRASGPRRGRLFRSRRLGGRPRAGHAALRSRRRRPRARLRRQPPASSSPTSASSAPTSTGYARRSAATRRILEQGASRWRRTLSGSRARPRSSWSASGRSSTLAGRLRALSPRATLERGYAIVRQEGGIVRSARGIAPGSRVDVELAEGALGARVEESTSDHTPSSPSSRPAPSSSASSPSSRADAPTWRAPSASGSAARSSTAPAWRSSTRPKGRSRSSAAAPRLSSPRAPSP